MIASLPMYDRVETRAANDRFWGLIRHEMQALGVGAPPALNRPSDPWEDWRSPDLLLSQTCGMPYRTRLHGEVGLVAAPVWALPCPPGRYYSVLVAHRDDPRSAFADFGGARLAFNDPLSQSGWAAPANQARALGLRFGAAVETGAHRASARLVADRGADIAAIDAVTWAMIDRWDDFAARLKVIGHTDPTPALPYITALGQDAGAVFAALERATARLAPADRARLLLNGVTRVTAADYLAVPTPPPPAPAP